jgi:hypothetical protein
MLNSGWGMSIQRKYTRDGHHNTKKKKKYLSFYTSRLRSTWHIILSANMAIAYSATKNQEYDTHLLTKINH